jgi:hypothetical protein
LGLLSAALRWEAEGGGDSCATFYVLVWPLGSLMEEPRRASSRKGRRPPNWRPSAFHSRTSWLPIASLMGHWPVPGQIFVLVEFRLADSKGDQVLRADLRKKTREVFLLK